jgi:hypothetical protein
MNNYLSRVHTHLANLNKTAYILFTPINDEWRLFFSYYRDCWHEISQNK